ncbi:MAG TPA: transcriptional repressor [Anaerolineales bacterium]|nr:transcriptional repressor [Anaerolineales bacterium]
MFSRSNSSPPAAEWLAHLQQQGYRLTGSRRAVVETMTASDRVLNAMEIFDLARQRCASLGLVTVYRTLAKLEELALIERVHQPDDCTAYVAAVPGHQHLLICQRCGRAAYFGGDRLEGLMDQVAQDSGYQVEAHWLQLFGFCDACQQILAEAG